MEDVYGIKDILIGHEKGIRCINVIYKDLYEELKNEDIFFEYIISADRDGLIFVWKNKNTVTENELNMNDNKLNEYNNHYILYKKIEIHEKYIYTLCYSKYIGINELKEHKKNFEKYLHIYSGGNDKNIYLFNLDGYLELVLQGHKHNICSIVEKNSNTLISGDWSGDVIIWKIKENKEKNEDKNKIDSNNYSYEILKILSNHKHAVYVNCLNDLILSISQDNILHVWSDQGQNQINEIPNIHSQPVRDIIIFNENKNIITFSNDENIHIYDIHFNIIKIYTGHTGFIFYVFVNEETRKMISCGDDKMIKIWNISEIYDYMDNYDMLIKKRDQSLRNYEQNLISSEKNCIQTIYLTDTIWDVKKMHNNDFICACNDKFIRIYTKDDKKLNDNILKDFENKFLNKDTLKNVLNINDMYKIKGKENEIKVFNNNNKYEAYKFENNKWVLIGDVIDFNPSKKKYEGDKIFKEGYYDELFSIDIGNGNIKILPYNKNDNVYLIAENFCKREMLHLNYINEIIDFVNKNKPDKDSDTVPYVNENTNKFKVIHTVFSMQIIALDKIYQKIVEFNNNIDEKFKLNNEELECLNNIINIYKKNINNTYIYKTADINLLSKLFNWNPFFIFPVIDLFRILILNKHSDILYNNKYELNVFKLVYDCISFCINNYKNSSEEKENIKINSLLICCLRLYVNLFFLSTARYKMYKKYNFILTQLKLLNLKNNNINNLIIKIYFNYVIILNENNDNELRNILFQHINLFNEKINDIETLYIYSICFHTSYASYKTHTQNIIKKYDIINFIQNKLNSLMQQKNKENEKFYNNISLILESLI